MISGVLLRTQPDQRLAVLAGEGSKPAFEEMVRRYRSALVGYAAKIAPSARADDVVQESMVKAYLAIQRGDQPDVPKAWLYRIVRNTALNERRDWREFEHLDENYDGVEQPPQAAERRSEMRSLVSALGALPESQRTAIVQRELEGRGHDEIAASLGTTPGAVRQLIFRARETLRTGMGALVPIQVLRMALASGSAEPVVATAGAGIGMTAAKIGVGAVLATGVVVAGTDIDESSKRGGQPQPLVLTQPESAQTASQPTGSAGDAAVGGETDRELVGGNSGVKPNSDAAPRVAPPPRPHGDRPGRHGGAPPPQGGSAGGGHGGDESGGSGGDQAGAGQGGGGGQLPLGLPGGGLPKPSLEPGGAGSGP